MSVRSSDIDGRSTRQYVTEDTVAIATDDGNVLTRQEIEIDDRGPRWVTYLDTNLDAVRDRALALWIVASEAQQRRLGREPEAREAARELTRRASDGGGGA